MDLTAKLNYSGATREFVISFGGVMPQSELFFGFAGSHCAGDCFGVRAMIEAAETPILSLPMPEFAKTLTISISAVISRCTYRIRQISESFCCTVSGICRRVTAAVRKTIRHFIGNSQLPVFGGKSRVALGLRL